MQWLNEGFLRLPASITAPARPRGL